MQDRGNARLAQRYMGFPHARIRMPTFCRQQGLFLQRRGAAHRSRDRAEVVGGERIGERGGLWWWGGDEDTF